MRNSEDVLFELRAPQIELVDIEEIRKKMEKKVISRYEKERDRKIRERRIEAEKAGVDEDGRGVESDAGLQSEE